MRRRANKSHKVPNVKLRPAQPQPSGYLKVETEQCWAGDSQVGSDGARSLDSCPRPFKGVVVCATGVADKPSLFKQALELGATSVTAFTDRVTHLVAVDHGGAKYTCALERKVPILTPSWIMESYQIWLRGDDVDVAESVRQHRLPVFAGVILCPSGISDITRRTQINKILMEHGGAYVKNLERPVKVTHLLCSGDDETDKMRYAEKFNARGEARIHLIWEEWFWDSLEFGGRFDETTYQVRRPRPERKIMEPSSPSSSLAIITQEESTVLQGPRPALHNDDLEDETACVNILPAVTLQVWGGLLERRGYEVTDGEIVRSPSKSQSETIDSNVGKLKRPPPRKLGRTASVISAFRSANSFAPALQKDTFATTSQRPIPFKRASTSSKTEDSNSACGSGSGNEMVIENHNPENASGSRSSDMPPIFAGLNFRVLGEAKTPTVRNAIEKSGGRMVMSEDDETVDFIVVRLLSGSKLYREETDQQQRAKFRTECWLERCIHEERVCLIEDHASFRPLGINIPIAGAENIRMGLSGLDQSESCHTRRLLKALGIAIPPLFSRKSTHLLCPSGTGLKFEKACEWGIPVVSNEWLESIALEGVIPPLDDYAVDSLKQDFDQVGEVLKDLKGKGKAVGEREEITMGTKAKGKMKAKASSLPIVDDLVVDVKMNDITNNTPPEITAGTPPPPLLSPKPVECEPLSSMKKVSSLEHQPTIVIPPDAAFGQPNETLGSSSYYFHPSSVQSLAPRATPLVEYGTRQSSMARSVSGSFSNSNPKNLDDRDMRIPSSKSPSPMKGPKRTSSVSPVKLDPGATRALQQSITSLLGKRQSPEEEEVKEAGSKGVGRNGKKLRRQRSKPQVRQTSHTHKSPVPAPNPPTAGAHGGVPFDPYGVGASGEEHQITGEGQRADESMRVMYEDPAEQQERKRLLNLLKTKAEEDVPGSRGSGSLRTRKSTRIAGFH